MYSLRATRSALKCSIAPVPRLSAVSPRYSSTMHDNDPVLLETEKQRNLRKEQHKTSSPIRNAPGWNEHLASASEAAVKADRSERTDHSPHDLQEATINYVKQRHHSAEASTEDGASVKVHNSEERVGASEATYERDEVGGPLKQSGRQ